ncbi:hypothetical protein EES45_16295 [Streptomyces sp. ADI97-07]|nr:hypothetical protein EES45_16295 [Streptomyces sp. ADI97-07]
MYGAVTDGTLLGVQRSKRFLDTLTTVARTDLGYLLEARDALALVHRGRRTHHIQDPAVTLNWADGVLAKPFQPTDNGKLTRNDVTAKRDGGASERSGTCLT